MSVCSVFEPRFKTNVCRLPVRFNNRLCMGAKRVRWGPGPWDTRRTHPIALGWYRIVVILLCVRYADFEIRQYEVTEFVIPDKL